MINFRLNNLEETLLNPCPSKSYINYGVKIKRILPLAYVVNGYRCSFSIFYLHSLLLNLFLKPLRTNNSSLQETESRSTLIFTMIGSIINTIVGGITND